MASDALPCNEWFKGLLRWFKTHKRVLPWRRRRDWYGVVVAEVMLIRTRSEVAARYYKEFMKTYPSPAALCLSSDEELRAFFKRLGLPERGPKLRRLTCTVLREYGGTIPCSLKELIRLPCVGRYVASVLLTRVCGKPTAFVDSNVQRVVTRMTGRSGVSAVDVKHLLEQNVPKGLLERVNLALLDLAFKICKPGKPRCAECPVSSWCKHAEQLAQRTSSARPSSPATDVMRV